jgi:hypothetical protein
MVCVRVCLDPYASRVSCDHADHWAGAVLYELWYKIGGWPMDLLINMLYFSHPKIHILYFSHPYQHNWFTLSIKYSYQDIVESINLRHANKIRLRMNANKAIVNVSSSYTYHTTLISSDSSVWLAVWYAIITFRNKQYMPK